MPHDGQDIAELFNKALTEQPVLANVGQIEDVEQTAKQLLKTRYRRHKIVALLFAALLLTVAGVAQLFVKNATFFPTAIFIAVIALLGGYAYLQGKVHSEFMRQFALAHGYTFKPSGTPDGRAGSLFSLGRNPKLFNLISGAYLGQAIEIFNYRYAIRRGRDTYTFPFTVFEIDFPAVLPQIFLHDRQARYFGSSDGLNVKFPNARKIDLEGGFHEHFDLWVGEKFEIEALQIFTPDLMARLMDQWQHLSIEFVGNHIYIYENKFVNKRMELLQMHDLARHLILKLAPVIQRMGNDVEAMQRLKTKNL